MYPPTVTTTHWTPSHHLPLTQCLSHSQDLALSLVMLIIHWVKPRLGGGWELLTSCPVMSSKVWTQIHGAVISLHLCYSCDVMAAPLGGWSLMAHVWVTSPAQAHGHVSTSRKPLLPSPASWDVYATMVLSCAEELWVAYMMEQVKPQHSLSRVRPVLVTYGAEVCCPLEVIFFSFAGAVEGGISVCLMVRAQAHHCFLELFPGLRSDPPQPHSWT